MNSTKKRICVATMAMICLPFAASAQQVLTLDQCREMAIGNSKDLSQAKTKMEMAGYDRKIALANYFPNISATGAYLYNNRSLALVDDATSAMLTGAGTNLQQAATDGFNRLVRKALGDGRIADGVTGSSWYRDLVSRFTERHNIAEPINAIGQEIDGMLHFDIEHVFVGMISLQQPVFMGGKIVLSNQMAKLAEELSASQYDMKYADIIVDIDGAYWQIVSLANKKKLAESYSDLLHQLERQVEISVQEGVSTRSDALQIKVKVNEADMLLTKATNGLTLAKMLLCKEIGLPLDSSIVLADETLSAIPLPQNVSLKSMEAVWEDRPETRSLDLARQIYDKKAGIARADMMPKVLLMANWLMSNPNAFHGYSNSWNGGLFSVGVAVNVPVFHGFEALQKTRKARAEVQLYRDQLDEAKQLINLQVEQSRQHYDEAFERLGEAENNLASAEENLRTATVGFEAGVINTVTVLGAETAWLQAHSEYIDAGIDLQMASANLMKAEGNYSKR